MAIDFKYAYFILIIPFAIIWALLFILSRHSRKEQLIMSLLFLPLGPVSELFYFQDYWNPASILSFDIGPVRVLLEDFLFSFFIAGIGAVIYEAIFAKRLLRTRKRLWNKFSNYLIALIAIFVSFILFAFGVNSIFYTSSGAIVAALLIVNKRKDLLANSLLSGVVVMFIMFISYFMLSELLVNTEEMLRRGWLLHGTPLDIRVLNIPFTEMIWGFAWGMLIGPLYEFLRGMCAD